MDFLERVNSSCNGTIGNHTMRGFREEVVKTMIWRYGGPLVIGFGTIGT